MALTISLLTVVVADYDIAIQFFTQKLGFLLGEDTGLDEGKRWVTVHPPGAGGTGLLLARAASASQQAAIGAQSGGRVFLFLRSDDFWRDHAAFMQRGVRFRETPRRESYGMVAVFEDICGNLWDLIGPG